MSAAPLLRASVEALDDGRPAHALTSALQAWRAHRAPELADAVEALSAKIVARLPPVSAEGWEALARERRVVDVPRLIARPTALGRWESRRRLEVLARFDDDPRVAAALVPMVAQLPFALAHQTHVLLFELLLRTADVRGRAVLQATLAKIPAGDPRGVRTSDGITRTLAVFDARAPAPLDDDEEQALVALQAAQERMTAPEPQALCAEIPSATEGEADFLRRIYDDPDDDDVRRVYADWLLERGELRGELIQIQLAARPSWQQRKRARWLVHQFGRQWLGAIEPAVMRGSGNRWERGFPSQLAVGAFYDATLADDAAWNTVRKMMAWYHVKDFLVRCALRGLRELDGGVELETLARMLTRGRPYPCLEQIVISLAVYGESRVDEATRRQVLDGEAMPRMRRVALHGSNPRVGWDWLLEARCMAAVEEVSLYNLELNTTATRLAAHPTLRRVLRHWAPREAPLWTRAS